MPKDVSPGDYEAMKQILKQRVEEIERICDAHLRELLRVTRQDPGSFFSMDYKKRFMVLSANEQILKKSYRRQNKQALRMKGII